MMPDKPSAEEIPAWALKDDGSLGDTMVPKLDRVQEHLARIASERYEKILELERDKIELSGSIAHLEQALRESREKHEYFISLYEPQHRQALEERDALRKQVAELSKPVTDEEWRRYHGWIVMDSDEEEEGSFEYPCMNRKELDKFLLSRQPPDKPSAEEIPEDRQ